MSVCKHHCYEIGGPFIAENPKCPIHGSGSHKDLEERVSDLEDQVNELLEKLDKLTG